MILTVTPNPSLDLLYRASTLVWDDANRIPEPRRRPGGQGINVARAVRSLGGEAAAVTMLGGATGEEVRAALEAEGTSSFVVAVTGPTRTFIAIEEASSGRALLLNSPGPVRSGDDANRLIDKVAESTTGRRVNWVASCGSLPPGFAPDFHARVGDAARANRVRWVADCDGEALLEAARAGCDLLVPNQHEASRLLQVAVEDHETAALAARALLRRFGVAAAAITLGRKGAVLATDEGTWAASAPVLAGSAVGAGDAFLAALLLGIEAGTPPPERLRIATAAGAAVLLSTGATLLDPEQMPGIISQTTVRRMPDD